MNNSRTIDDYAIGELQAEIDQRLIKLNTPENIKPEEYKALFEQAEIQRNSWHAIARRETERREKAEADIEEYRKVFRTIQNLIIVCYREA